MLWYTRFETTTMEVQGDENFRKTVGKLQLSSLGDFIAVVFSNAPTLAIAHTNMQRFLGITFVLSPVSMSASVPGMILLVSN